MGNSKRTKILVCVNDAKCSMTALNFACYKAKANNFPVELLNVIKPADYKSFLSVEDKMRKERLDDAEKLLKKLASNAKKKFDMIISLMVSEGVIVDEIVKAVKNDPNIGMIVVGVAPDSSSGDDILSQLVPFIGSKILTPVIMVPGNLTNKQIEELT